MRLLPMNQDAAAGALLQQVEARTNVLRDGESKAQKSRQELAFIATVIFSLLLYLRPQEIYPGIFGVLPLAKLFAVFAMSAYLISKMRGGERISIWPIEMKMILVIFFLGILFIPVAANPGMSIDKLNDPFLKVVVIFFLMINLVNTRKRFRSLVSAVVLCGIPLGFSAIKSYLNGEFVLRGTRIQGLGEGLFGNPNDLAICLNMLLPLTIVLGLTSHGIRRLLFLGSALIMATGIMVTYSRGGFLGLIFALLFMLWKLSQRRRIRTMILVFVAVAVLLPVLPGSYGKRILTIFSSDSDTTGSSNERKELLDNALNVISHHPIVGVGFGNFPIYSIHELAAHNSYVEITAELGVFGLLAYLIVLFSPLLSLRRLEKVVGREIFKVEPNAKRKQLTGVLLKRSAQPGEDDEGLKKEFYYLIVGVQATLISYMVVSFFGSVQYLWYLYYPVAYAVALVVIHRLETYGEVEVASEKKVLLAQSMDEKGSLWNPVVKKGVYWSKSSTRDSSSS
ncbi:MAG: O-antigen ligase family protein [Blastocatellia bacterium]|nr:O-antigen ligase family protein [Blastocatellia bacterium]